MTANYRFIKSGGSTLEVSVVRISGLQDRAYDIRVEHAPGGARGFVVGSGKPRVANPTITCLVEGATESAARLAASDLVEFAQDSQYLQLILTSGHLEILRLPGNGLSVAQPVRKRRLSESALQFEVDLELVPASAPLEIVTFGGETVTFGGSPVSFGGP